MIVARRVATLRPPLPGQDRHHLQTFTETSQHTWALKVATNCIYSDARWQKNETQRRSAAAFEWILQSRSVVSVQIIFQMFGSLRTKRTDAGSVPRYSTPFMNSKNSANQARRRQ